MIDYKKLSSKKIAIIAIFLLVVLAATYKIFNSDEKNNVKSKNVFDKYDKIIEKEAESSSVALQEETEKSFVNAPYTPPTAASDPYIRSLSESWVSSGKFIRKSKGFSKTIFPHDTNIEGIISDKNYLPSFGDSGRKYFN